VVPVIRHRPARRLEGAQDVELSITGENLFSGGHAEFTDPMTRTRFGQVVFSRSQAAFDERKRTPAILRPAASRRSAPAGNHWRERDWPAAGPIRPADREYKVKAAFLYKFAVTSNGRRRCSSARECVCDRVIGADALVISWRR